MNNCLHKQTAPKGFRTSVPRGRRRRKQEKLDGNVQLLCRDFAAVTSFLTLVLLLKMIIVHVLCNAFIELQYAFHTSALTLYLHIPNFSTLYSLLLSALTTPLLPRAYSYRLQKTEKISNLPSFAFTLSNFRSPFSWLFMRSHRPSTFLLQLCSGFFNLSAKSGMKRLNSIQCFICFIIQIVYFYK